MQQLNTLISLLLGDLSAEDRQKIMTICTIDVHSRDVVGKMIAQRVESSSAFQWQSQLRHRYRRRRALRLALRFVLGAPRAPRAWRRAGGGGWRRRWRQAAHLCAWALVGRNLAAVRGLLGLRRGPRSGALWVVPGLGLPAAASWSGGVRVLLDRREVGGRLFRQLAADRAGLQALALAALHRCLQQAEQASAGGWAGGLFLATLMPRRPPRPSLLLVSLGLRAPATPANPTSPAARTNPASATPRRLGTPRGQHKLGPFTVRCRRPLDRQAEKHDR